MTVVSQAADAMVMAPATDPAMPIGGEVSDWLIWAAVILMPFVINLFARIIPTSSSVKWLIKAFVIWLPNNRADGGVHKE